MKQKYYVELNRQEWRLMMLSKRNYLVPSVFGKVPLQMLDHCSYKEYECFLLGKHTVERVCSGLSPLRRDRLWC